MASKSVLTSLIAAFSFEHPQRLLRSGLFQSIKDQAGIHPGYIGGCDSQDVARAMARLLHCAFIDLESEDVQIEQIQQDQARIWSFFSGSPRLPSTH